MIGLNRTLLPGTGVADVCTFPGAAALHLHDQPCTPRWRASTLASWKAQISTSNSWAWKVHIAGVAMVDRNGAHLPYTRAADIVAILIAILVLHGVRLLTCDPAL